MEIWERLSETRHNFRVRIVCGHRGDEAMTIPDYLALGVLALWAAARVYLTSRRF